MRVSISQPAYMPWLGYFSRIAKSDLAIVLDNVMLERSSKTRFTNRNKIKTADGWAWLTVPVKTAGIGQPLICDTKLDIEQNWAKKHYQSIIHSYNRAPYFDANKEWLECFYSQPWTHLSPMIEQCTSHLLESLKIKTPLVHSSKMPVEGRKSELILNLCKYVGATTYISGAFGRNYLNFQDFKESGISIEFDDYVQPSYPQLHGDFQPHMSALDLLLNCGERSCEFL
jgi:hypothetical protein